MGPHSHDNMPYDDDSVAAALSGVESLSLNAAEGDEYAMAGHNDYYNQMPGNGNGYMDRNLPLQQQQGGYAPHPHQGQHQHQQQQMQNYVYNAAMGRGPAGKKDMHQTKLCTRPKTKNYTVGFDFYAAQAALYASQYGPSMMMPPEQYFSKLAQAALAYGPPPPNMRGGYPPSPYGQPWDANGDRSAAAAASYGAYLARDYLYKQHLLYGGAGSGGGGGGGSGNPNGGNERRSGGGGGGSNGGYSQGGSSKRSGYGHGAGSNMSQSSPSSPQNGSNGSGGGSNSPRSNILEEFRSNKSKKYELLDIVGYIVEFSGDQHGSRFIQQKLETASNEDKQLVCTPPVINSTSF